MVNNETLELVNYAKDIDMDLNAKVFVLVLSFIYVCFCLWYSFRMKDEMYWQKIIKYIVLRIPSLILFTFYPLFGLFILRGVDFMFVWKTMLTIYVVLVTFITFAWFIWHAEFMAALAGLTGYIYKKGRGFRKKRSYDND